MGKGESDIARLELPFKKITNPLVFTEGLFCSLFCSKTNITGFKGVKRNLGKISYEKKTFQF